MNVIEALILGIVQGVTEFLPISSTAHVILASTLLDLSFPGLMMEIFLHLASVLAVIIFFRKDIYKICYGFITYIKQPNDFDRPLFQFGMYIIMATIISGLLGVWLTDYLDATLKTPAMIAVSLIITGLLLLFIEKVHSIGAKNEEDMRYTDAIFVAIGQTLAVIPGISRSGSTLVAALLTGLDRDTAVRFSFLLAIPVITGSTVLLLKDFGAYITLDTHMFPLIIAFVSSFVFSILGIRLLINFLRNSRLTYFAIYCFIIAVVTLLFIEPYHI